MAEIPTTDEALALLSSPLEDMMLTQRAVRRVRPEPVDDALIVRCIELALKAPTGSNGQNWEFVVVKDPEVKAKFAARYRPVWKMYQRVGERDARKDESTAKLLRSVQWQVENFEDIPVLVVPCLRGNRVPIIPPPALLASSYYGSIYPSVQNLLLSARAMGIGASLITMPLWNLVSARRILGLPLSVTPACIVPMGWPRGKYGPTTRRPVGEVVHVDRFGNQPFLAGAPAPAAAASTTA